MKRLQTHRFRMLSLDSQVLFAILVWILTISPTEVGLCQSDFGRAQKTFEDLLVSDTAIPDLIAISKTDTLKDEALTLLVKIKRDSLMHRLKHTNSTLETLQKRITTADAELVDLQDRVSEKMGESKANSSSFPLSRVAAEQLLIAAQLELQKVNWDLASESALLEDTTKEKSKMESEIANIEKEIAARERQNIQGDLSAAQNDLQRIESLVKKGILPVGEEEKAARAVSKVEKLLVNQELQLQLLQAQHSALQESQQAEVSSQIRKLTARKKQIESYIGDLFVAMKQLNTREQLLVRSERSEKSIATWLQLHRDFQIKKDEIQGLIDLLDSIERKEK